MLSLFIKVFKDDTARATRQYAPTSTRMPAHARANSRQHGPRPSALTQRSSARQRPPHTAARKSKKEGERPPAAADSVTDMQANTRGARGRVLGITGAYSPGNPPRKRSTAFGPQESARPKTALSETKPPRNGVRPPRWCATPTPHAPQVCSTPARVASPPPPQTRSLTAQPHSPTT